MQSPLTVAQVFVPQGPAPSVGARDAVQSGDGPGGQTGTVSGAVQAVLTSPADPNTMYLGTVSGGVWVTHDGGASWTPLTDNQRSLSIASLTMDPGNPNLIVAGTGITSNGAFASPAGLVNRGPSPIGLLASTNGGASWTEMGGATLAGKSVVGVQVRDSTWVVAVAEPTTPSAPGGLFISNNGGASFTPVIPGSGGGTVAVTSLAADPASRSLLYASLSSTVTADRGVYVSTNAGASWAKGLSLAADQSARLAAGPDGSVVAAIYAPTDATQPDADNKLVALMLSKNGGAAGSWISLGPLPNVTPGGQAATNLAVAIDRNNPNIVYLAGDATRASPFTVPAYRITLNPDGSVVSSQLTDSGASGTTVHADARNFAFDAGGRLIMVGDGGVYALTNPQGNGVWRGLNATLQVREAYTLAFDAVSQRLIIAAQDTGAAVQRQPNDPSYEAVHGGDGVNAAVNDVTHKDQGQSIVYTSTQHLGLTRMLNDRQGTWRDGSQLSPTQAAPVVNFVTGDASITDFTDGSGGSAQLPFASRIVLNRNDPVRIAIGTNYVYVTTDPLLFSEPNAAALTNVSRPDGMRTGNITALAYGTHDNSNALLAGAAPVASTNLGRLFFSATATAASLTPLTAYGGATPSAVVFDARSADRFFVADTQSVWSTVDRGSIFHDMTPAASILIRPVSLEFVSNNGVNAVLVGGLSNAVNAQSPLVVADSDSSGILSGWRTFGFGLPNAIANQLAYNPAVDVLAVSLWGRGAWLLYDVSAYFPTAQVLRFGLADNDSTPPESILTDGASGSRALEKVGAGTLTINGTTRYTGATRVMAGQFVANGNLSRSSSLAVDHEGSLAGTGIVPSATVFGTLAPGHPGGTLTVNGNLSFQPGSTYQVQAGLSRTAITGIAALAGTARIILSESSLVPSVSLLSAAGGVNNQFDMVAILGVRPSFFSASLGYTATDVVLNLKSNMAATPGLGSNQFGVARAIDAAFNTGPGLGKQPGLLGLATEQIRGALSRLAGDNASVGQSMAIAAGGEFVGLMAGRAASHRSGPFVAPEPTKARARTAPCVLADASACPPAADWSAWASGFGAAKWTHADASTGASASQQRIGGAALGGDYRVDSQTWIGLAAGVSDTNYWVGNTGTTGRATGAHFGLYGVHAWPTLYVNAALAYAHFDGRATRTISGIGVTETAKSYPVANGLSARIEVGRPFAMIETDTRRFRLTPFAAVQPSQLWSPRVAEHSSTVAGVPGAFALNYRAQSTPSLQTFLGAQLDAWTELDGKPIKAWLRAAWVHEFLPERSVAAGFALLPDSSFTVDGARAASNAARLDFGVNVAVSRRASLFANGGAEFSNRAQAIGGTAGLRFVW